MKIGQYIPTIQIVVLIVIAIFSVRIQSPPAVLGKTGPLEAFSAERAIEHLKVIAAQPHSGGTAAHDEVRDYIADFCESQGLEVEIQDTLAYRDFGHTISSSHVSNISATLKGTNRDSSKHILVLSHYDSQPNTLGAADDGAGVVAMMETIRALALTDSLSHDVIFLFTDQEEVGLLGAEAFVHTNPIVEQTGIILNYESRGNSGVALTFEFNDENGWVIRQFAQGAPYPIANSMAYEIYRILPNDSDFSMFRAGKYTGINQANIDGFVNYHSMTDQVENIDPRIIQHYGMNMLGMIRHVDRLDLEETKSPNVNFFNPVGRWFVYFPSWANIPMILVCLILFGIFCYLNRAFDSFTLINILKSSGIFLLATTLSVLLSIGMLTLILKVYPHYTNFYANNFYNSLTYLWTFLGSALLSFGLIYRYIPSRLTSITNFTGALGFCILLLIGVHFYFSTASYFFYFPLAILLICLILKLKFKNSISPLWYLLVGLIPMILLWSPVIYNLYILFSLVIPYASVILFCLLLGLTIPIWKQSAKYLNQLNLFGVVLLVGSLLYAHIESKPSIEKPLQSNLSYVLDLDDNQAFWVSNNKCKDEWTKNYVHDESTKNPIYGDRFNWPTWTGPAELKNVATSNPIHEIVQKDSNQYQHHLKIPMSEKTIGLELFFEDLQAVDSIFIDKRPIEIPDNSTKALNRIRIHAIKKSGLTIQFRSYAENFSFNLIERKLRIPTSWFDVPLPSDHIHGPGGYADCIFVTKTYFF